jgi:hypothetical protein
MTEIRVHLTGEKAKLGLVPASDVARLIILVEKAAAQAAAVLLGRPKTTTGRYAGVIERAVDFRLIGIEEGSVVPALELPRPSSMDEGMLELEVATLGESALDMLLDAGTDRTAVPPHPIVAKALLDVADGLFIGERYEALKFEVTGEGRPRRTVTVDAQTRSRLRDYVVSCPPPAFRTDDVVGVLVEADFEKRTARLRTPTEPAVVVDFSEELDDEIQAALRQPTTLRGEVVYDPKTNTARAVHVRELLRGEQLILGVDPTEFWQALSFEELARRQASGKPVNPEALYDEDATSEERDAYMSALAELL